MALAQLQAENAAMAARIAELEAHAIIDHAAREEDQRKISALQGRLVEVEDELADMTEMAEFVDGQRIEADNELANALAINEQREEHIAHLEAQLVASHQQIQQLQAENEAIQHDFEELVNAQVAQLNAQPPAMEAPDVEQGASGVDYEPPPSPMDEDLLSDADSHVPFAE